MIEGGDAVIPDEGDRFRAVQTAPDMIITADKGGCNGSGLGLSAIDSCQINGL
jgi:hypothetical protein